MSTKWENGKFFKHYFGKWRDFTNTLTLPELEQAVIDNNLTVYQALTLAYLLGQKINNV